VAGVAGIDKAVGQVFITARRDTQAGGLDDADGGVIDVFNAQAFAVRRFAIPFRDFEAKAFAQKGLPGTEFFRWARAAFRIS